MDSTSQFQPQPNQVPVDKTSKTSKAPWAVAAVASVVAIAGIAFGIYGMMKPAETANTDNLKVQIKNTDGTTTTLETDKIETIKDNDTTIIISDSPSSYSTDRIEVQELIKEMHKSMSDNVSSIENDLEEVFRSEAFIKLDNINVTTVSDEAYGLTVITENAGIREGISESAYEYAVSFLNKNGFNKTEAALQWPEFELYYNPSTKTFCDVNNNSPFTIACAKGTWIRDSEKDLIKALANNSNEDHFIIAKNAKVVDSTITPYQRVIVNLGSAAGLYYRVSPDSEWQFFKGTQDMVSCSEFTGDVAKAYAGTQCWDSSTNQESTVNPNN